MAKAPPTEPDPTSFLPPVAVSSTTVAVTAVNYPDSLDSSPRSRGGGTDTEPSRWDDVPSAAAAPTNSTPSGKLRLMCSYDGRIIPRPHDKSLCYLGGETRMVVVDRHTSLADLTARISRQFLSGRSFTLKYQLPHEDLDALISVTTDEDLDIMIEEYDRCALSLKPSRLRLFVFPAKHYITSSMAPLLEESMSEPGFVDALNGTAPVGLPRGFSGTPAASVNRLLGLDSVDPNNRENGSHQECSAGEDGGVTVAGAAVMVKPAKGDVHSMPDSPMVEAFSSFRSTSSAPSVLNLPPIGVKAEEKDNVEVVPGAVNTGVEDQLCQNTLDPVIAKRTPEPELPPARENLTPPIQSVQPTPPIIPKPVYYQHPSRILANSVANPAASESKREHTDLNYKVQMSCASDTGFLVPQALPSGYHYLPATLIPPPPIPSFYQVHHQSQRQPQPQQAEQQIPLYFYHPQASTTATQNHAYNLAGYQSLVVADPSGKPPPAPTALPAKDAAATISCADPATQPEMGASLYRSSATPAMVPLSSVPLIHPIDQQQYAGYRLQPNHLGYNYGDSFPQNIFYNHTLPVSTPSASAGEAPLQQSPDATK